MFRKTIGVVALVALLLSAGAAVAQQPEKGPQSKNITELMHAPFQIAGQQVTGTDFAFRGNLVVAGSYQGLGIFKITPGAPYLKELGTLACAGGQGDVSIWGHLVFFSVDATLSGPSCHTKDTATASNTDQAQSNAWEGVRIIDISDPSRPQEVSSVYTACGSHTNTLYPDGKNVYLYIQSYPLGGQGQKCNASNHSYTSVVKVPLNNPEAAKVVSTPSTGQTIGCHDVTVVPARHLAFAACITESQVWDIKDPENPKIIAHIYNPAINIHHSTAMTWDGKVLALGDEFAGAEGVDACEGNSLSTTGAMWYYDVSDPTNPTLLGHESLPRMGAPDQVCTTHNFNIIPMRDPKKYLVVSAYYTGGLSVTDFSDPANPKEYAYAQPDGVNMWSVYWYNGRLYTSGEDGMLRVYELAGTGAQDTYYFKGNTNPQTQINSFR
jgi:hypothetical protein